MISPWTTFCFLLSCKINLSLDNMQYFHLKFCRDFYFNSPGIYIFLHHMNNKCPFFCVSDIGKPHQHSLLTLAKGYIVVCWWHRTPLPKVVFTKRTGILYHNLFWKHCVENALKNCVYKFCNFFFHVFFRFCFLPLIFFN